MMEFNLHLWMQQQTAFTENGVIESMQRFLLLFLMPPEGPNIMAVQHWLLVLSLVYRDFSRFSKSF